jgi:hypothetical protein
MTDKRHLIPNMGTSDSLDRVIISALILIEMENRLAQNGRKNRRPMRLVSDRTADRMTKSRGLGEGGKPGCLIDIPNICHSVIR